ncbi:response regulator transcription factor [Paenibacillus glycinis]|uniref:Response regulator n=1 Tax=Paenibacillus glycinis TaxID=2697035 RepID=A0ABW9XQ52_9BACL|nr:response regulator [Paenibacillus glycinis]NBD24681.1 response regulator [Paenibacillus glycinis]
MNGTLLIVEDQAFFRKGLRKLIEEHAIGWTVIGEAENGREAVSLIASHPPDLILTDIRMPGMDGIALAEHVHRNRLDIALIMLTGHEDFKYAQAALRYGAIDFLLKPCNEETLIGVLRKAYEHVQGKRQQQQRLLAGERSNQESLLRAHLLRLPHDKAAAAQAVERCLRRELLFVRVASYRPADKQYRQQDMGLLQFALFNIIAELLEGSGSRWSSIPLAFDRFALFVDGPYPEGFEASAEASVRRFLGLRMEVMPAGRLEKPGDLLAAYERFLPGPEPHAGSSDIAAGPALDAPERQSKAKELQVQLSSEIALGRPDRLKRMLEQAIRRLSSLVPEDAKLEALTLALAMKAAARQSFDAGADDPAFGGRLEVLRQTSGSAQTAAWAEREAEAFLAAYGDWRSGKNRNAVMRALDYLEGHYMESCTLNEMAERFYISSAYFSKLFKKETGDNFSTYLTRLRMRKAAMLLLNTDMKVFEIASAVGYDDPNYFTNVFRMLYRLSPSDYRKRKP